MLKILTGGTRPVAANFSFGKRESNPPGYAPIQLSARRQPGPFPHRGCFRPVKFPALPPLPAATVLLVPLPRTGAEVAEESFAVIEFVCAIGGGNPGC